MMSVQELFYGETEPVWIVGTAAAQVIHHPQQKPRTSQNRADNTSPPKYKGTQRDHSQDNAAGYVDSPQQRSHHQQRSSHQQQQQHHYDLQQRSPWYQSNQPNHDHYESSGPQHNLYDQYGHRINHGRDGSSQWQQQYHPHRPNHNASQLNYAQYEFSYEPSAPPFNAYHHNTHQKSSKQYWRTQVVTLKVPVCCGACEDRVVVALTAMRGVESVFCDLLKEKVTVTGNAAPADVLRACRKLFKKSEMWEDSYC